MSCECTKESRDIKCELHGDQTINKPKKVRKTDKKVSNIDTLRDNI
jgi:hypothetical protein